MAEFGHLEFGGVGSSGSLHVLQLRRAVPCRAYVLAIAEAGMAPGLPVRERQGVPVIMFSFSSARQLQS